MPPNFAGILPTLPQTPSECEFEPLAYKALKATLRRGSIAYDVGASYGIMSALMAWHGGAGGRVHAFEANARVLEQAADLSRANRFTRRVRFNNFCVGETSGKVAEFYVVPGLSSVASTRGPEILKFHPESETASVPLIALDDYAAEHNHTPDVIKIDIEGSEYLALQGARRILERRHPDLVIETHGWELLGIGGSVAQLCGDLEEFGYLFHDLAAGEQVAGAEYARRYEAPIGYLLASTKTAAELFGTIPTR